MSITQDRILSHSSSFMNAAHQALVRFEGYMEAPHDSNGVGLSPIHDSAAKDEPKSQSLVSKAITADEEVDLAVDQYEDITEDEDEQVLTFPKEWVRAAEETTHVGNLKRMLQAEMATSNNSSRTSLSMEDWPDSPPESLLLQTPIYEAANDTLHRQHQAEPKAELSQLPEPQERRSFKAVVQGITTLFSGLMGKSSSNTNTGPVHDRGHTNPGKGQDSVENIQQMHSQCAHSTPASPCSPKLTHRQVVADIQRSTDENVLNYPGFKKIPPAPEHWTTGNAVMVKDTFEPSKVQRDFNTPTPSQTLPFVYEQNHLVGNLMGRENDAWTKWHKKHPAEHNPFFRMRPAALQELAHKTGQGESRPI
jgi:hypothetical protein